MRAFKAWWAALARGQRVNLGLYALTALSTVALLFELAAGDNPPRDVDLASRGPTSTLTLRSVPSTTTSTSTTTSSTTSTTVPAPSTSVAAPTTRAVPPTTRRIVPPPAPEPAAPPPTDPPPTAPPPTEPPITTTQPPATTTTTPGVSQAGLLELPVSLPAPF